MKPIVAMFVDHPRCAIDGVNATMKALRSHYDFKIFTRHELEDNFFDDVHLVCVPGGVGDADTYSRVMKHCEKPIRRFVRNGGHYLGICMGAYWAGPGYLNIVDHLKIDQYIRRPTACTRRPHAKGMMIDWLGQKESMYFFDGCAIVGDDIEKIARYPNGDTMAGIQGKVGLIGCHPESEEYWYKMHSWMPRHWHQGRHHQLLLGFTNYLMNK